MKKRKIFSIIITFILIIGALSGILFYYLLISQPLTPSKPLVQIYVNSSIYNSLSSDIDQYKQDVISQGYEVNIISWSDNNVVNLKNHVKTIYNQNNLSGLILIGDMPFAWGRYNDSYYPSRINFPCDLFLMDLDGNWSDTITYPGFYDIDRNEHNDGNGDWTPEIWLSRINPSSINVTPFNHSAAYKNYFNRNFNYRHGFIYRPHKALLYIDDDWSSYRSDWVSNFTAYNSSQLDCYSKNSYTTAVNYMNNLTTKNYELAHILAHSLTTYHTFGPLGDGSDGKLTYNNLHSNMTSPIIYNLYTCHACNYIQNNNMGTTYLFTSNTLTVIGSARSGGMDLYQPFYDALSEGKTIGDAFKIWFHNSEIEQLNKEELYYGMTILGDPLLTV
ncbi:MAG: hypothetical protein GF317_18850 [Candidatus Lokiarchaeota archaeon]|nr:hypothetical protein [Candidatus Lokiarchaeota archaeon]MBD3201577.1 hypothetical protein [Candidatus Lokiarchaeota archaeon]